MGTRGDGKDGGSSSLMLGIGMFAFAVVVAVKTGAWYADWRELATIDAALANRQMLRAVRTVMSAVSLVVLTGGAIVAWRGWQTVQAQRYPPHASKGASSVGDDAVRFGWMLIGLAGFGAVGLVTATWLIGEKISAPAVAEKVASLRQEAADTPQPYVVATGQRRDPTEVSGGDAEEDLRDVVLLHCMPGNRTDCTPRRQAKIERWLYNGVRAGRSCATLARELGVPEPGVQPWCDDLSAPEPDATP